MNWIIFEPLYADITPPARATVHSAGFDVKAHLEPRKLVKGYSPGNDSVDIEVYQPRECILPARIGIPPGYRVLIPLGFKAQLPPFYEAQVRPRSGTALKKGLSVANAPGTIDADYPNEWGVILRNDTDVLVEIEHGERVAQIVIARVEDLAFLPGEVGVTTDRTGGFGSTGA